MPGKKYGLIALIVSVLSRLAVSYFPDRGLVGGVDFVGHMQPFWYLARFANLGWDPFWYAGYPLMKLNSPLIYLGAAALSVFADPIIVEKFVADIFFLLAPLAFYALLKRFDLTDRGRAIAVLAFSFFPALMYFFWSNSISTTICLVFAILCWISLDRYMANGGRRDMILSVLLIGLTILIHQLTAALNMAMLAVWCLARYRRFPWQIFVLAVLLSAFWLGPFLLEYSEGVVAKDAFVFFDSVSAYIGAVPTVALGALLLLSVLYALARFREKDVTAVSLTFLFAAVVLAVLSYNRIMALMAIPFALLLGLLSGRRAILALSVVFILFSAGLFFSFEDFFYLKEKPQPFDVPAAENRVIYYPMHDPCSQEVCLNTYYVSYLPLLSGQEVMHGFRDQFLKQVPGRNEYFTSIYNISRYTDRELHDMLAAGFVNSVVVQKRYPDYVAYFSGSSFFKKVSENADFVVFSLEPKPTYVEISGKPVTANVSKDINHIMISFDCAPGTLLVKESFDSWWTAELDGKAIRLSPGKYGFMSAQLGSSGHCTLDLRFAMPAAYYSFYLVSVAALAYCAVLFRSSKRAD